MSWFSNDDHRKNDEKKEEPASMSKRFFTACLLILGGIIVLQLALQLLAQIWIWLVLAGVIALAAWVAFRVWSSRGGRW